MPRLLRMFPVSRLFRMFPIWICEGRRLSMFLGFNPANAGIRVDRHMHLRTCLESDLILSVQPTFELVVVDVSFRDFHIEITFTCTHSLTLTIETPPLPSDDRSKGWWMERQSQTCLIIVILAQ